MRTFELHLWTEDDKESNLQRFDREWDAKAEKEKDKASAKKPSKTQSTPQIDWLTASQQLLDKHHHELTSNPLRLKAKNLEDVHVPLGLMERKEKERPKFDRHQEFSPDRGSEAYQQGYTEPKRVEHDAFLAEIGKRKPGQHVVILGEPGAGKTTLLTRVWKSLLDTANPEEQIIVVWIPLAAVENYRLEEYLRQVWLGQICEDDEIDRYWESFKSLRKAGRVWLLLDGADEMGGDGLAKIETSLKQKWAESIRTVITCRLNLWDASPTNSLERSQNFQVYRTLDFKYANPAGVDEVQDFIDKWFKEQPEDGQKLRAALDEAGKERIKDLAKNPLRLTLLCNIWNPETGLPDTQANLYGQFVDKLYAWKADKFADANLKPELNRAMGDLAKQGLNRADLRFRFTQAELEQFLPSLIHRKALTDLGWLNCVGVDESNLPVYAFFHPTFQEYFAACSIDDWDYFLPRAHEDRPVCCEGEKVPTYRVFEQEWRQVIVLWIGREDVGDELKEEFIEKLTNFRGKEGWFYSYRDYCMAAICVREFKDSIQAESIVQQIVEWGFGCFNIEKQKWITYLNPIESLARDTIPLTHRVDAITILVALVNNPDLDDSLRPHVAEVLGTIDEQNKTAISVLIALLGKPDLYNLLHSRVADTLRKIAVGNEIAIAALIVLLGNPDSDNSLHFHVANTLGTIAVGNETAIAALVDLLGNTDLDDDLRLDVVDTLGTIAVGNETAIIALITLLGNPDLDNLLHFCVADTLSKIEGNETAIAALVALLGKPDLADCPVFGVPEALGTIGVGNETAIAALIALLGNPDLADYRRSDVAAALGTIGVGNKTAIAALIALLDDPDLADSLRSDVAAALGTVDGRNEIAIAALVALLGKSDLPDWLRSGVAKALGTIDEQNETAIVALIALLGNPDLAHWLRSGVADVLGKIDIGNETAIAALVALLGNPDLSDWLRSCVAEDLGKIGIGNETAIVALVALLRNPDFDDSPLYRVAEALDKILTREKIPSVIWQLKNYVSSETYKSNFNQFDVCFKIIWQCAQTLSYPEFHTAYHPPLPTIPTNLKTLPHQLTHPNTIYIPHPTFNHLTQPNDIAQELANLICLKLNPTNIPEVQTIPHLKRHLLPHSQPHHLVIIIEHPHPTTELITAISSLHTPNQIQTIWLTTAPIPNALPPTQPDLFTAIQSAINSLRLRVERSVSVASQLK